VRWPSLPTCSFRGLDAETRQQVMDFVKQEAAGRTLLLITHEEREARFFSDAPVRLACAK
jgi:ABC-type transport system involved in cytochrome bd biosynthesis fused ATPase/permease subunit